MTQFSFNSEEHEPSKPLELLPAGQYQAMITASEIKQNRNETGEYVKLEYTIVDGEHANRRLWSNHNVRHENPEAERIAKGELSAIVIACGLSKIENLEELHDIPMLLGVGVERGKPGYSDQNRVRSWTKLDLARPAGGQQAAPKSASKTSAPPAAAKPAGRAPWASKSKAA